MPVLEEPSQEQQADICHKLTRLEQVSQIRRAKREERYESVQVLHQQGISILGIAHRMRMSSVTVRKYIEADTCPMLSEGASWLLI